VFLVLCGVYGRAAEWVITLLTLSVGLSGICMAGSSVNHLDIAPVHSGILLGVTNTIATIPGFVSPQLAKFIAKEVKH